MDEIIAQNLQNLEKEIDIQTQEHFTTPNRHDQKRATSQYITVRMSKTQGKEIRLKAGREKHQPTCMAEIPE